MLVSLIRFRGKEGEREGGGGRRESLPVLKQNLLFVPLYHDRV